MLARLAALDPTDNSFRGDFLTLEGTAKLIAAPLPPPTRRGLRAVPRNVEALLGVGGTNEVRLEALAER